jgi:hypothetical protein
VVAWDVAVTVPTAVAVAVGRQLELGRWVVASTCSLMMRGWLVIPDWRLEAEASCERPRLVKKGWICGEVVGKLVS